MDLSHAGDFIYSFWETGTWDEEVISILSMQSSTKMHTGMLL